MSRQLDLTIPGPAGLMFDPSNLTGFGQDRERAARAALERWCVSCGQPASHGFGCFAHTDGVWACADLDCRAVAEARAAAPSQLIAAE